MDYIKSLILKAISARKNSYSPYSNFAVGAALITTHGEIYCGFNIENASYSVTLCAERSAITRAVFAGHRKFRAIAIVGGLKEEDENFRSLCPPCGVCRQALREFSDPKDFKIILAKSASDYKVFTLEELLPHSFGPEDLA